ncbi:MAG: Gfo/Idh/MocA family oxidoreductase [Clostridia bacterium]|nr:Gfo/Idh/MocA family oxidoreductase [Clostridia bacterium]
MQNKLRFGIIGVGNMGTAHANNLYNGKIENACLTALCDVSKFAQKRVMSDFQGVEFFSDYNELLKSENVDAVIIATPHYLHPIIAKKAFEQGKNVLSEKPIGVLQEDIIKLVEYAKKTNKAFGIMFNQRTNALFKKAKEIIDSGELGVKKRLVWQVTNWYRTQSYYETGTWRGTWRGEGGGVLMNQAPHQLDLLQWLFGMPKSVLANLSIAKHHNIEVEDDAELLFEYEDGASAVFITSTGECPGTNRLEILGDKGKIVIEKGVLTFTKLKTRERDFCFQSDRGTYNPESETFEFKSDDDLGGHNKILQNFCNHILFNEELIVSGIDGVNQILLTESAYMSHFLNKRVEVKFYGKKYDKKLKKLYTDKGVFKEIENPTNEDHSTRWQVKW